MTEKIELEGSLQSLLDEWMVPKEVAGKMDVYSRLEWALAKLHRFRYSLRIIADEKVDDPKFFAQSILDDKQI